jgi:hypothetical protein
MSDKLWQSQLEINQIFDKRLALTDKQLTALTELVIEQGKIIAQLTKTEPCTGKHCACQDGAM